MHQIEFPYGVSNFEKLVNEGRYYVDRTRYIEKMERMANSYLFFLRPRRFGKSLTVSVMEHYYGKQHREKFGQLFGKYYIGQHPTPRANSYLVLKFDFSGIRTNDVKEIDQSFSFEVKQGILQFMNEYPGQFEAEDYAVIQRPLEANEYLSSLLTIVRRRCPGEKVFLLIDEYDHFTNEIIAFSRSDFDKIVSRNGIVRKFFEIAKKGTQSGVIDRIFITGVSPITLDSLTSGFNIGTDLSLDPDMHQFMGFTGAEVADILRLSEVGEERAEQVLADVRSWYDGYRFSEEAVEQLYNPDMVWYFATYYHRYRQYPKKLIDTNVASDYGKMLRMLNVGNVESNRQALEEIIQNGTVTAQLTEKFSFEREWRKSDFVSLLFYMGLLTVQGARLSELVYRIPNQVIRELYFDFLQQILFQTAHLSVNDIEMNRRMAALALEMDIQPLREALQLVLQNLDNRDARKLDEKHVKTALIALISPTGVYMVKSEQALGQGYPDILLLRRPPILDPKRQYIFELKYLKKTEAHLLEQAAEEGRTQLQRYLSHPDIQRQGDFTAFLWVVMGYEVVMVEEVSE